jgi:hypothetical protein
VSDAERNAATPTPKVRSTLSGGRVMVRVTTKDDTTDGCDNGWYRKRGGRDAD